MEEKQIIEGNRLISEFMNKAVWFPSVNSERMYNSYRTTREDCLNLILGSQFLYRLNYEPTLMEMEYHTSWSWIMPVLEKISRMEVGDGITYVKHAYPRTFGMLNDEGKIMVRLDGHQLFMADTLIEATYNACLDFIQWHNSTPNK